MRSFVSCLMAIACSSQLCAADHWPQFRGPTGDGHAQATRLPTTWSDDRNVVWKTPIHDRGWSSPVIWDDQIWVTTSTPDGHTLFAVCVDRQSGRVLHDVPVFTVEKPEFVAPSNSYASPTAVIEQGRVYVHFGTNGTACLDTYSGRILWTRRDLNCNHEQGAGSSPILLGDLFIVNVDGRDVQYVIALNKLTGETVWKTQRSIDYSPYEEYQRKAYCTPTVFPFAGHLQLVSPGAKAVFAYDPASGRELWKVRHAGWSMTPRPVFGQGLVFAVVDYDVPQLWAIRPDGTGDVTDTHVVWKVNKGMPSRPSFLLIDDLLFLVNSEGIAACLEAKTGELLWKERIEGKFSASALYADGKIYFCNENAVTTVLKPSRQFEVLAVNKLGDELQMASPAAVDQALYIRTQHHLYRLEDRGAK
ncbi:MAG: PQQ-binding-like beta-propeller repeat protein [Planctomycetes bacterium]|nr:PQQ-binding-like beta-propeller repeat protein [Planctomycetota bacterium]